MVFLQLIKIFILLNGIYNDDLVPEKYKLKNGRLVKDGIYAGPWPEIALLSPAWRYVNDSRRKSLSQGQTRI